jgi:transcriptional regulator with XRE-family HTH domain
MTAGDDQAVTLKMLRERSGLTQRQIAEALGVTTTTIGTWERGEKEPRPSFLQVKILIELLNCTLDELVEATRKWHPK